MAQEVSDTAVEAADAVEEADAVEDDVVMAFGRYRPVQTQLAGDGELSRSFM